MIDWKHYLCTGDWDFTVSPGTCWPDPAALVATLKGLGVQQVFVSVHPFSEPGSRSFSTLESNDFCVHKAAENSTIPWGGFGLPTCNTLGRASCLYDPSNPAARDYVWSMFKASYFDKNITNFWTDGTEPAGGITGGIAGNVLDPNASFTSQDPVAVAAGERLPGEAAWMMWPVWHAQTVYNGAVAAGAEDGPGGTWSLARSAWAGSHKYNTIVWSGDISSNWGTLAAQVQVGLSAMLTLPYWNSDTGGFKSGDWQTMGELQVRWFQFSMWTSIMRLHGSRTPKEPTWIPDEETCDPTGAAGGPIEPWVYGTEEELAITSAIKMRAAMLPYLRIQIAATAEHGQPMTRPLWYDYWDDADAMEVSSQFMVGAGYMVAPVVAPLSANTTRSVYFPKRQHGGGSGGGGGGGGFKHFFTGKVYPAGVTAMVPVSSNLTEFPLFVVLNDC